MFCAGTKKCHEWERLPRRPLRGADRRQYDKEPLFTNVGKPHKFRRHTTLDPEYKDPTYPELVEEVLDSKALRCFIRGTNQHAELRGDDKYKPIPLTKAGEMEMRIFIGVHMMIKIHCKKTRQDLCWNNDTTKGFGGIARVMPRMRFQEINRHFVFNMDLDDEDVCDRDEEEETDLDLDDIDIGLEEEIDDSAEVACLCTLHAHSQCHNRNCDCPFVSEELEFDEEKNIELEEKEELDECIGDESVKEKDQQKKHPYHWWNNGYKIIRNNFKKLIGKSATIYSIDEMRVASNARGQPYKNKMSEKPIKKGVNLYACACHTSLHSGLVIESVPFCGPWTYKEDLKWDPRKEGAIDNIVHQLIERTYQTGNIYCYDNWFTTIYQLEELCMKFPGLGLIGTFRMNRHGIPLKYFQSKEWEAAKKKMKKGDYVQWKLKESDYVHMTFFRDSSDVLIMDTCVNPKKYCRISRKGDDGKKQWFLVPEVIRIYNEYMGSVDAAGHHHKDINIDRKCRRKWNRIFLNLLDTFAFTNTAIFWADVMKRNTDIDHNRLRRELLDHWRDVYLGEDEVPLKARRRTLTGIKNSSKTVYGTHRNVFIDEQTPSGYPRRLKCVWCTQRRMKPNSKTRYKCNKCSTFGDPVGFCGSGDCFKRYHEWANLRYRE